MKLKGKFLCARLGNRWLVWVPYVGIDGGFVAPFRRFEDATSYMRWNMEHGEWEG